MRKSRYVTFLLAASMLSACDQNNQGTDAVLYSDPSSCAKDMDSGICKTAYDAAQAEHLQQAPKFTTQAECEAAGFQQCEQAQVKTADGSSGGSFFMPMMMGYMMGRMLGGGGGMMPQPNAPATARPVYSDRAGYLHAGGAQVGRLPPGATSLGPQGMATRVTSRGGFGGSARSFSGGS